MFAGDFIRTTAHRQEALLQVPDIQVEQRGAQGAALPQATGDPKRQAAATLPIDSAVGPAVQVAQNV
jgi:hypothetical protein